MAPSLEVITELVSREWNGQGCPRPSLQDVLVTQLSFLLLSGLSLQEFNEPDFKNLQVK